MNITYEPAYMGPLVESVEEGRVPMALVDRAVRRVLEQKFRLGLFENPYVNVDRAVQVVHSQANQDLALRAGREGIVLLKNDKNLLPLKKDLKSVAVIGPNADDVMNQLGDYSPKKILAARDDRGRGNQSRGLAPNQSHRRCAAAKLRARTRADLPKPCRPPKAPTSPLWWWARGSTSRTGPTRTAGPPMAKGTMWPAWILSGVQEDLIQAVFETGTPTVVVLINGRPLSTRWTSEHVPAIVEAWEPGERGGEAVADVLFGNYNPSGRLAISVPRHSGQLPVYYNYKPSKAYWIDRRRLRRYARRRRFTPLVMG